MKRLVLDFSPQCKASFLCIITYFLSIHFLKYLFDDQKGENARFFFFLLIFPERGAAFFNDPKIWSFLGAFENRYVIIVSLIR